MIAQRHGAMQRILGYTKHPGSASSIVFAASQGLQYERFDHVIRHIMKRAFLQRTTGHVRLVILRKRNSAKRLTRLTLQMVKDPSRQIVLPVLALSLSHVTPSGV
jgi:hypothetical protein